MNEFRYRPRQTYREFNVLAGPLPACLTGTVSGLHAAKRSQCTRCHVIANPPEFEKCPFIPVAGPHFFGGSPSQLHRSSSLRFSTSRNRPSLKRKIQVGFNAAAITLALATAVRLASAEPEDLSALQTLPLSNNRDAYEPAAAWGKGVFLAAWKSGHLAEGDLRKGFNYIGDIAACRLDKTGRVLDSIPLAVSTAEDLQERPRVAFGEGVFMVVWQDLRNARNWDVYACRISPEGKIIDPAGIPVCARPGNQALPEVAWDGQTFLVAWQDLRSDTRYEVYGARVSADGKVIDPGGKPLVTTEPPYSRYGPVVAGSAPERRCLLFWRGSSNNRNLPIAGCLWIANCTVAGEPYVTTDNRTAPGGGAHANFPMCLAAGPGVYLAAWTTQVPLGRGNAANDAHAAIFGKSGTLVKKLFLAGAEGKAQARIRNPAAVWAGTRFVTAWDQYDAGAAKKAKTNWPVETVYAASVDPEGAVSLPRLVSGSATEPAVKPCVASDGAGSVLIAYENHPAIATVPIRIGFRLLAVK